MKERTILIILTAVFFLLMVVTLLSAGKAEGRYILCDPRPGSMVNVHTRPLKSSMVSGWVECGQYVETDGKEKNGFVHVVGLPAEDPEGWIWAGYLVDEEPWIETYLAEVWEGPVIARKSVNGKQKCVLKDGKTVTVYAQTHMWAVTSRGYIMCDWLREVE